MNKLEKIQALVQAEIEWALDNGDSNWPETISQWINDLYTSYSEEQISQWYRNKTSD
jgi:hypothetical protein